MSLLPHVGAEDCTQGRRNARCTISFVLFWMDTVPCNEIINSKEQDLCLETDSSSFCQKYPTFYEIQGTVLPCSHESFFRRRCITLHNVILRVVVSSPAKLPSWWTTHCRLSVLTHHVYRTHSTTAVILFSVDWCGNMVTFFEIERTGEVEVVW